MDKILLLLILIIFIIISYNPKSEILKNRVNDNIDKQEDFNTNGVIHKYDTVTTCPACFVLKGGLCQPMICPLGKRCATMPNKKQQVGNCYPIMNK
jgi:hypothetical protein